MSELIGAGGGGGGGNKQSDEQTARWLSRRGGGSFLSSQGQTYVSGPNEIEMLHNVCDLLKEIRNLLKAQKAT